MTNYSEIVTSFSDEQKEILTTFFFLPTQRSLNRFCENLYKKPLAEVNPILATFVRNGLVHVDCKPGFPKVITWTSNATFMESLVSLWDEGFITRFLVNFHNHSPYQQAISFMGVLYDAMVTCIKKQPIRIDAVHALGQTLYFPYWARSNPSTLRLLLEEPVFAPILQNFDAEAISFLVYHRCLKTIQNDRWTNARSLWRQICQTQNIILPNLGYTIFLTECLHHKKASNYLPPLQNFADFYASVIEEKQNFQDIKLPQEPSNPFGFFLRAIDALNRGESLAALSAMLDALDLWENKPRFFPTLTMNYLFAMVLYAARDEKKANSVMRNLLETAATRKRSHCIPLYYVCATCLGETDWRLQLGKYPQAQPIDTLCQAIFRQKGRDSTMALRRCVNNDPFFTQPFWATEADFQLARDSDAYEAQTLACRGYKPLAPRI